MKRILTFVFFVIALHASTQTNPLASPKKYHVDGLRKDLKKSPEEVPTINLQENPIDQYNKLVQWHNAFDQIQVNDSVITWIGISIQTCGFTKRKLQILYLTMTTTFCNQLNKSGVEHIG